MWPFFIYSEKTKDNSYLRLVSQFVEEDKMDLQDLKDLIAQIENNKK